jgi:hypothetical protein
MTHPYESLPTHCFWSRTIAGVTASAVDPVIQAKFKILPSQRVATAGSCFAQHIGRSLAANKFNYFVTETAHPLVSRFATEYGYGLFSARYGNIYTSRQLVQLIKRAYGMFLPGEDFWQRDDGRIVDPFRPRIQPNGFSCLEEFRADRRQHFAAVRRAIEEMDVLVFTLGLTECWVSRADGAAFPLCPGVAGGAFDAQQHAFVNLKVTEVVADMMEAYGLIKSKNPGFRLILTVSPVPLAATMEDRSILLSTTYSKAVLRVAAEELASDNANIAYFPSYEIITGSYTRGSYFAEDLRSVTDSGVAHVMRLFMNHYASLSQAPDNLEQSSQQAKSEEARRHERSMQQIAYAICDEEVLDSSAT